MKKVCASMLPALLIWMMALPVRAEASGPCEEPQGPLTLEEALVLALSRNPILVAYGWHVRAAESETEQAGAFNNPQVAYEVENAGGTGTMEGMSSAEKTLLWTQEIRTAGKRSGKRKLASIGADMAGVELEIKRRETAALTERYFIELLAAQSEAAMAQEMTDLSAGILDIARERLAAGKVAPLEERKAAVSYSSSRVEMENASRRVEIARRRLASTWGSLEPRFERASGDLGEISPPPTLDSLMNLSGRNPELLMAGMELARREAALSLEKVMRFPDLTLSAGARWFEESGDKAFIFGLSIPLPLFDRNGAAVRQMEYMMNKAAEERKAAEIIARTRLAETFTEASAFYREAAVFADEVLPAADIAFKTAREGYLEGKWSLLEVLDAHRTLVDVRRRNVEALAAYHMALSRLGEITGKGLLGICTENNRGDRR